MHIAALRISNFRRLKSVLVDLDKDISILVGANNSGKTSTAHLLQLFVNNAKGDSFSIHDFNSDCWKAFNDFGNDREGSAIPKMSLDLWLSVDATSLYRVIDLLPGLAWQGSQVGLRIEYAAKDDAGLRTRFQEARTKAAANAKPAGGNTPAYNPLPRLLTEYLTDGKLHDEFELRYYVLDQEQFNGIYLPLDNGYVPQRLFPENGVGGREILVRLLRIDVLSAQRHLSDKAAGHRAEELSKHLGRFYNRNLRKREEDHDAIRALAESEALLNAHLADVFKDTLESVNELGYPGFANPKLLIKSALNPVALMSNNEDGTNVFYVLDPDAKERMDLPDRYNGLGFKNLIYIVIELLDRHAQWMEIEDDRPPLHLIFIEEPEVHLHAQLQQVFIRKIRKLLEISGEDAAVFHTQFVVTTHSPHILYERGFKPIRYFRRSMSHASPTSEVLNLSAFYNTADDGVRDFLERYLKLTHCDLFFSDAALLVEGNVERLLMPLMIEKAAPQLRSACLCILEVGGAYAYRFKTLIEFLGITTLVVTDLDSVTGLDPAAQAAANVPPAVAPLAGDEGEEEEDDEETKVSGKACKVLTSDAVTSNQTLRQWLPGRSTIDLLLAATDEDRTQAPSPPSLAVVRVVYQNAVAVTWNEETYPLIGRTLEEAFAIQNLAWTQQKDKKNVGLRIPKNDTKTLAELFERIHTRVKGSAFKKTDFALAVLEEDPKTWVVPRYIEEGVKWLEAQIMPVILQPAPAVAPIVEEVQP